MNDVTFATTVRLAREAAEKIKLAEADLEQFKSMIKDELSKRGLQAYTVDEKPLSLHSMARSTLDRKGLLKDGVSADMLARNTKVTLTTSLRLAPAVRKSRGE